MNLPDFLEFGPLNDLRAAMSAPLRAFDAVPLPTFTLTLAEQGMLKKSGIEIGLDSILVTDDRMLAYKGSRIILYIRNPQMYEPRYHLLNCHKINEMREQNRLGRYVVANREDGLFELERGGKRTLVPLQVCQFCLEMLVWEGFSRQTMSSETRAGIVRQFSLKQFFDRYGRQVAPEKPRPGVVISGAGPRETTDSPAGAPDPVETKQEQPE